MSRSFFPSLTSSVFGGLILFLAGHSTAQVAAFPGALGFAANATGGRAGTVYHVTTLADSGAGSFRDAVSQGGRIIVFDVGGYISLSSAVSVKDNLTIAGQTAPGGGIGVMGREVSFNNAENVIVRHFRFRQGDFDPDNQKSGINLLTATNIMLDHISIEFAQWNGIDAVNCDQVTLQNSIVADSIFQQFGAHIEHLNSSCSLLYNLWVNGHNRQPLATINTIYINNVVYNYQAGFTTHTSGSFFYDLINNYFITGPASGSPGNDFFQVDSQQSIYASGNLRDSDNNGVLGGSTTAPGGVVILNSPWSALTPTIPTFSTIGAFHYDVSSAGALPRDQVDSLVVSQVKTLGSGATGTGAGTAGPDGGLYTHQSQTGLGNSGYGVINGGVASIDTDGDGMPDYWEKAVGLNFNSNDAMSIAADGYANIEHYLNWLADPHALTVTNTAVDVDLWQYTSGYTNSSPVYSVNNASHGEATLSGHTVHFTPGTNFAGLGGFQFVVLATGGSACTNIVNVLVSPLTLPSNLIWQGDGTANLWGNGSGINWLKDTNLVAFASGDTVTFDDTGLNAPAINLSGSLPATAVYVLAAQDYTFSGGGAISGPAALFKTGSGRLNIYTTNTFAGGTTIHDGVVQLGDGVTLNGSLTGNITNNDTLIYATPGAMTNSAGLAGSGVLIKNGAGAVTLNGVHTFSGVTTINAGSLNFAGTPPPSDITNNGALGFAPNVFTTFTNLISGPGTVTVSGSGVMLTLGNANSYTGGTTNASGVLMLANSSAAGTGPVVFTGGSVLVGNGVVITNDFSIPGSTSDLSMASTNNVTGTWAGNIVNLGSGASWRPGSDGGTLIFTGNALQGARNFIVPRGTVQIASNAVVSATGTATAFGRDTTGGNRSANVTLKDHANVTLGVCNLGGNQAGGNVTLTVQNNASLSTGANNFDLQNVSRATAVTTLRLNGGTMTVGGFSKSKTTFTNVINFNGGVLQAGANNVSFLPAFNLQTANVQAGGAKIDDGGFAISINAPFVHDPALGAISDGGFAKFGSGTLTLIDMNTYNGPTIIGAGTLVLSGATIANPLAATTNICVASGAILDARAESPFSISSGRMLWGGGFLMGSFTMSSGAVLAPGSNSVGTLTFSNSLMLGAGSRNIFEISHSPFTNDSVVVLGALTSGGTLTVTNIGGSELSAGDNFKLFNAASYSGAFSTVQLPPLPFGLDWNTNVLNTTGTISVILTTRPVVNSVSLFGNSLRLSGTGGVGNANFLLLSATNLATRLSDWTPLLTNQFDGNGNFNFTNAVDAGAPQNFYLLKLP